MELGLSTTLLSGTITQSIGTVSSLTIIDISNNQLSGSIPISIGTLSQLTSLNISKNQLDGTIPESIGILPNIIYLDLHDNQLSGLIPKSIGSQSKGLLYLDLSNNHLCANCFISVRDPPNCSFGDLHFNCTCSPSFTCGNPCSSTPTCQAISLT
uniref:EGF-like domain-containing protein n=1 Tax=Arcella intermedia TaxID=1963864 RepID=A0A6B2LLZ0_9EUKA